jgi:hypothetical protein
MKVIGNSNYYWGTHIVSLEKVTWFIFTFTVFS